MTNLNDLSRGEKLNQGGAWVGDMWLPHNVTDADRASSETYGNGINEEKTVRGFIRKVMAFNGQKRYAITQGDVQILLPNWKGLYRDLEEGGAVDAAVELEYEGTTVIKAGTNKGKNAQNVGIYPLR